MALKSYHRETLNDNWYEERAEPLNGVLPRDRVVELQTTTATDFDGSQPRLARVKPRMVNDSNLKEAFRQTAHPSSRGTFRSVLPRPDAEPERSLISTQQRVHVNHFAASFNPSSALPSFAAGGRGGRARERGKATSGAISEVYKTSVEPQRDTRAQRSWMYSTDPMIVAMQSHETSKVPARGEREERSSQSASNHRQITAITSVRHRHQGVFVDDEPGDEQ